VAGFFIRRGTREEELAASEQMMVASDPGAVSFITLRPD
jgi:hypothetical protein